MSEPTSITIGALLGGAVSISGVLLGAHVDALLISLSAAFLATFFMRDINSLWRAAAGVLLAGMAGGYLSPIIATVAAGQVASLAGSVDTLRMPVAAILGMLGPSCIPILISRAERKAGEVAP